MASLCVECDQPGVVISDEGVFVCSSCGLIQPGSIFSKQSFQPVYVCPGPAKILRTRSVSSRDKWVSRLRQYANMSGIKDCICKKAVEIYDEAVASPDWKTRKTEYQVGVLVACLYHACNGFSAHRSPQELCVGLDVDPKSARRMVKVTQRAADDVHRRDNCERLLKCRTNVTQEMLPRCACRLSGVPLDKVGDVVRAAREIYAKVRDTIDNHRPDTIAAGLLSVAVSECDLASSNEDISDACLVAPNTVRSMATRIRDALNSELGIR